MQHYKESHKSDCKRIESVWQKLERTFLVIEPSQPECGICFEAHPEKRVLVPGCNHGFCYPCLFEWRTTRSAETEDLPSTCPLCRKPILQGVEDDVLDRARYLGKRAAVAATPEEKDALTLEALAELDKLFSANQERIEFRPLLAKAEVLKSIGETNRCLDVMNLIRERHATAIRNREKLDSLVAQAEQLKSLEAIDRLEAIDQIRLEMEAMNESGEVIQTGHPLEFEIKIDSLIVYAEIKADNGAHEEVLECLWGIWHNSKPGDLNGKQRIRVHKGILSASYSLGHFERVLEMASDTLEKNREFPYVYKYMALAQRDQGNVAAARDTVNKGLLYSLMDEFEREELLDLYKELVDQSSQV
jgi:hypothetical protein